MRSRSEKKILRIVLATGVSSIVTQLLTIREFLSCFAGNEFLIAIFLFNWLLLGAAGTLAAGVATPRLFRPSRRRLAALSIILAALPTVQLLAIRLLRDAVFVHGAAAGFYQVFTFTFFCMAPYAVLVGFALPFALFVIRRESPEFPGAAIYITDNAGDLAGGVLFSFLLVHLTTPMQALALANLLLVVSAILLQPREKRLSPAPIIAASTATAVLITGLLAERASLSTADGELVFYDETKYGRVTITSDAGTMTLFENGLPVSAEGDAASAEETVHYPLAQLPLAGGRILLVSASGGVPAEVEKHAPDLVDYLEIDPIVSDIQLSFGLLKKIPGLRVINRDARAFLAEPGNAYDAIIVGISEPETFGANRFFTARFFELAAARLAPGGVLAFTMEGFGSYLGEPHRRKLSIIRSTVSTSFEHVLLLPGGRIHFLCGHRPLSSDIPALLEAKGIETEYIAWYYDGDVTPERIKTLNSLVDDDSPINTDMNPRLLPFMFNHWFSKFQVSPAMFAILLAIAAAVYVSRLSREEFTLFSTGWMTMGSELLVILAFQIYFGYIYYQIGLIVTVFLAGLLPGAILAARTGGTAAGDREDQPGLRSKAGNSGVGKRLFRRGSERGALLASETILAALMAAFILLLGVAGELLPPAAFLVFGFSISLVCGFQFPVVLKLRGEAGHSGIAGVFAADLAGAAFGTLVTSVLLVPFFGIYGAAGALVLLKIGSFIILASGGKKAAVTM